MIGKRHRLRGSAALGALAVGAGVLLMATWLSGWQRLVESQIFYPEKQIHYTPRDMGLAYEDVWFESAGGVRLHGWFVPAAVGRTVLLFCHGNAGNVGDRVDNIMRLNRIGISVFIFDYRGYGNSRGRPSEEGLYRDVEAACNVAQARAKQEKARLVIFGRSLGGVAAVHVAARNHCAGLILESTFTHLGAMARIHFPMPLPEQWLSSRFNARKKISAVRAPILFFHGDQDDIVPLALGRRLFMAAPEPKEFVTLEGAGHNDTYLIGEDAYFAKFRAFCEGLPL